MTSATTAGTTASIRRIYRATYNEMDEAADEFYGPGDDNEEEVGSSTTVVAQRHNNNVDTSVGATTSKAE
jgi:hypothetical protein